VAKKKTGVKTMPIRVLEEKAISYKLHQQTRKEYSAEGVAEDLGVPVAQVLKAMIVQYSESNGSSKFALIVTPGDKRLSLKKMGVVLGDKNTSMASPKDVQRVTGFQVGAVSVIGLRRDDIPAFIDQDIFSLENAIISAGRPDMGIELEPINLSKAMPNAQIGDYCEE
jgi:Cys-tRNA(Pro)/Cys-tRNA(Cys) deacylase